MTDDYTDTEFYLGVVYHQAFHNSNQIEKYEAEFFDKTKLKWYEFRVRFLYTTTNQYNIPVNYYLIIEQTKYEHGLSIGIHLPGSKIVIDTLPEKWIENFNPDIGFHVANRINRLNDFQTLFIPYDRYLNIQKVI
jgi:hypothetical protein